MRELRMFDYQNFGLPAEIDVHEWITSASVMDVMKWPELDLRRHYGGGVYCVMLTHEREVPHYIGKTSSVIRRMAQHTKDHVLGQPHRPVRWLGIPDHAPAILMRQIELLLIVRYQPGGNDQCRGSDAKATEILDWSHRIMARRAAHAGEQTL